MPKTEKTPDSSELTSNIYAALEREKQIKGWLRKKKIALIDSMNPAWKDLSEEWYESLEEKPKTKER